MTIKRRNGSYGITVGQDSSVLDVDIDPAVSDFQAVNILVDINVGYTGACISVGIVSDNIGRMVRVKISRQQGVQEGACDIEWVRR